MRGKKGWILTFIIVSISIVVIISLTIKGKPNTNIVFIVIDALRSNHLSCYGYQRNTTPNIDILAENGLCFKNCIAQSSWTLPSIASIFTSKYPSQIGVGAVGDEKTGMRNIYEKMPSALNEKELTLAELLNESGYETISISPNYFLTDKLGLAQGFDKNFYLRHRKAKDVIDLAIEQISEHVEGLTEKHESKRRRRKLNPFFMYLHFMDIHVPTHPPRPYDTLYSTLDNRPHNKRHYDWSFKKGELLDTQEFENYKSHKIALYDGALNFIDFQIGRLIRFINSSQLNEDIIVVIASDHGEEFWDHALFEKKYYEDPRGYFGIDHGHTMFGELLEVPLIFYGKDIPKKSITQQVRNIDIMPSLLSLIGIEKDTNGIEGINLIDKIKRNDLEDLVAYSEDIAYGYEKNAIQDAKYKFISGEIDLFYNKLKDPLEKVNIIKKRPKIAVQYKKVLNGFFDNIKLQKRKSILRDEEVLKELRSLGYIK